MMEDHDALHPPPYTFENETAVDLLRLVAARLSGAGAKAVAETRDGVMAIFISRASGLPKVALHAHNASVHDMAMAAAVILERFVAVVRSSECSQEDQGIADSTQLLLNALAMQFSWGPRREGASSLN